MNPFLCNYVGDNLRIVGGVEDGALQLQFLTQFESVDDVSVVSQRHASLVMVDHNRLGVDSFIGTGSAVAVVSDGHISRPQVFQHVPGEDLVGKAVVLVVPEDSVVVYHDAAAFLSPVLQCEKPVVNRLRNILSVFAENAEDAAFLMKIAHSFFSFLRLKISIDDVISDDKI